MLKIENVGGNNFRNIPSMCRYCLYWQTSDEFGEDTAKSEMEQRKLEWLKNVTREFGNCMKIAYLNSTPIGFAQYAPAIFFPRTSQYASGPLGEDAIFIACLFISSREARGGGFGTAMLKEIVMELGNRGFKAVETFARKSSDNNPSGPLRLYLKHGFRVKSDESDFPLLRFEL